MAARMENRRQETQLVLKCDGSYMCDFLLRHWNPLWSISL